MGYGSPHYWGHRLGIGVPRECVRWNRERVRGALHAFLKDRVMWPGKKEFDEAGMTRVYAAATYHGGIGYWAEQFGYSYGHGKALAWPEERIAAELWEYTRRRPDFPTKTEFHREGRHALYNAISREGGTAYWAARLGLVRLTWRQRKAGLP
jgi:hypothetical protein